MKYSRELAIFWAWNVNSYKRYAVASLGPGQRGLGSDDRTTGFRVVGDGRRSTSRIGSPAAT